MLNLDEIHRIAREDVERILKIRTKIPLDEIVSIARAIVHKLLGRPKDHAVEENPDGSLTITEEDGNNSQPG